MLLSDPLFEGQEALDLQLPCFYLTALLPLTDLGPGEGATEFVLGSHHVNLSALGLTTAEAIADWADTQPQFEATCRAGSICLFHGYTLHRGGPIRAVSRAGLDEQQRSRDVIYYGFM